MRTFHISPIDELCPFVDRLWGWESTGNAMIALPTLLPGTGAEFYFHYRTPFRHDTAQAGQCGLGAAHLLCVRRKPVDLCGARDVGFIAVRFRAGMLHRFVDIPGGELMDQPCSIEDLWGREGKALFERVAGADSLSDRSKLIQHFLLKKLRSLPADSLVERAVSRIYRDCSSMSIKQLASQMGIGKRQLERRFVALTGQTPADVRRLSRLQKTVRALMLDPSTRTLDAALANGYYDQSHFIHDFRELTGAPPQRHLEIARAKTHFYNTPIRAAGKMAAPVN
ncbi:MAG TPA: helix-turn-helix domain-containing protein [Gallionella sp.]|nr:helix-turn-helix domain-containing protein [Gallionella sp.]